MTSMGIHKQIKTDNVPAYVSTKMKAFYACYNIKNIIGLPQSHRATGYRKSWLYIKRDCY